MANSIAKYINSYALSKDTTVLYFYFEPDIEKMAQNLKFEPKQVFNSLIFFSTKAPDVLKLRSIFEHRADELVYVLQDEDIEELKASNTIHNPHRLGRMVEHDPLGRTSQKLVLRVLPTQLSNHQLLDLLDVVSRIFLEKGSIQRNQGPPTNSPSQYCEHTSLDLGACAL